MITSLTHFFHGQGLLSGRIIHLHPVPTWNHPLPRFIYCERKTAHQTIHVRLVKESFSDINHHLDSICL